MTKAGRWGGSRRGMEVGIMSNFHATSATSMGKALTCA